MLRRYAALVIGILSLVPEIALAKTKSVDCSKGESIQAAIVSTSPPVVIEFTGVCAEYVTINQDNVTLRGVGTTAVIDGSSLPAPKQDGVTLIGASNTDLENFTVQGMRRGIQIQGGSGAILTGVTSNGNRQGVFVQGASNATLTNVTANDNVNGLLVTGSSVVNTSNVTALHNSAFGVSVWDASSIEMQGLSSLVSDNNGLGLVVSAASFEGGNGCAFEANDNSSVGIGVQLGGVVQFGGTNSHMVTDRDGEAGIYLEYGSTIDAAVVESSGSTYGAEVYDSILGLEFATITGNSGAGVYASNDATVNLSNSEISNNPDGMDILNSSTTLVQSTIGPNGHVGLLVDGGVATSNQLTVSGDGSADIALSFGSRGDFQNGTTAPVVTCDNTVLTRGDISCTTMQAIAITPMSESGRRTLAPKAHTRIGLLRLEGLTK